MGISKITSPKKFPRRNKSKNLNQMRKSMFNFLPSPAPKDSKEKKMDFKNINSKESPEKNPENALHRGTSVDKKIPEMEVIPEDGEGHLSGIPTKLRSKIKHSSQIHKANTLGNNQLMSLSKPQKDPPNPKFRKNFDDIHPSHRKDSLVSDGKKSNRTSKGEKGKPISKKSSQVVKERIVVRHPEVLSNLSCIDSVIFSCNGVLTTGTQKIMAITSLKKNYILDAVIGDLNLDDNKTKFGSRESLDTTDATATVHSVKIDGEKNAKLMSKVDEQAILQYLKYKFDSDSKFYNSYKEKIEMKEGKGGINEKEIEKYSEKSQEFERELDGEFIEEVFDEESDESFAYIRNGNYNHMSVKNSGKKGQNLKRGYGPKKNLKKKLTKDMARN